MTPIAERSGILAVVGMTREAKILGPEAPVLIGGGDATALSRPRWRIELARGVAGVVSFGLCGALDPSLKVGDLVIGEAVADGDGCYEADAAWAVRIAALPCPAPGSAASPAPSGPWPARPRRPRLRQRTGAIAVDLESYSVAQAGALVRRAVRGGARRCPTPPTAPCRPPRRSASASTVGRRSAPVLASLAPTPGRSAR